MTGLTKDKLSKKEHYTRYGWSCGEDNLKTLPPSAPPEARDLAKWLTLEGRRSSIEEWLKALKEDGKIHGKFWPIGAWTQRMSHSQPNQANIFSVYPDDRPVVTAIDEVKKKYDGELRSCWEASEGSWLVGTDADGIQLRVLAHYMDSPTYINAITKGDKKLGTDIHNVNKDALGPICKSRDDAKTFIYAWLLGAGIPKVASILGCSHTNAQSAVQNFLDSLPELKRLKTIQIPKDAKRGFFMGLDGRRVPCSSGHLMLAGYLQAGEAVIMKHANVLWRDTLDKASVNYKQVDFVHDEWQTEVYGSEETAKWVGVMQQNSIIDTGINLEIKCPLDGSSVIGKNWKETH